jgi:DNA anti-recombination protein RmuC
MSPSTFTAYLQVIAFGLRGMQIEQRAHEVMAYVADLTRDFERFSEDFELVGKHLGNAQTKFTSAEKRLDKFETKLERASEEADVEEIEADVDDDPPYAIEAA